MLVPAVRSLLLSALLALPLAAANNATPNNGPDVPTMYNEATVAQLEAAMASGKLTSEELTNEYIKRIIALDQNGPGVNSVIELNPDALKIARYADELRRHGIVLGPLHGIPVLLKGNVDTGDKMQTTAGSFALLGRPALIDSTVAQNLRNGGAVILGKTNLSEWANFRSFESISGWSGWAGRPTIPTASIAILAVRARAQQQPFRRTLPQCHSEQRPMEASCALRMRTASWGSNPP